MKNIAKGLFLLLSIGIAKAQEKPNFLFIITDDQDYLTIQALNNEEIHTPAKNKLVDEGVTFTHTYNQGSWHAAVCVASRAMLITGQNVFRAPRNENYLDSWAYLRGNEIKTEVPLWTEVFGNNGYKTFLTGKWHNSHYALLKSFDRAEAIGDGMYETRDENGNRLGYGRGSADTEWTPWDTEFNGHWTPQVNDIIYDENGKKKIGPSYTINQHTSELFADHEISRILKALEKSGKMDNTYVILTSDHGLAVGQHGLMGKQNQYEHSIRVPLIIKGPGLESGKKVHEMVYLQSLFATTCDLAGIEIPETVDFRSLKNLLIKDNVKGEDYIFGAYRHFQRMIRSNKYKLIVYPQIKRIQLFDMEKDPYEITDLSDKKEYVKIKNQLLMQLIKMQKENGDFMVLEADNYLN